MRGNAKKANARVQTIQFESKLVGKTLPYNVLLPVDYNQPAAKAKRYPVFICCTAWLGTTTTGWRTRGWPNTPRSYN